MNWLEYHPEPIQLHSGDFSHWLVRGDLIFQDSSLRHIVLNYWKTLLESKWKPPYNIQGIPTGGLPWAEALAEMTSTTKDPAANIVIVDDVITTGDSILNFNPVAQVRLAVVDRGTSKLSSLAHSWASLHLPLCSELGDTPYSKQYSPLKK